MIPQELRFHIDAALARNPGAELSVILAPFAHSRKGRRMHHKAILTLADGTILKSAVGPSIQTALTNLDTRLAP